MNLDCEESAEIGLVFLVVLEGREVGAIDVDLDTITAAANEVMIPVLSLGKARECGRFGEGDGVILASSGNLGESTALGDETAAMFVVDSAEPELAVVEIALIPGSVSRGVFLRADLNA